MGALRGGRLLALSVGAAGVTANVKRRKDRRRVVRVWLDGAEVRDCYYADARRGVVRRFVRDADGQLRLRAIIDAPHWNVPRRVPTEEIRGKVRIEVRR